MNKWKTLSRKIAFDNKWWKIYRHTVKLPNGSIIDDYFTSDVGDYVIVLPILNDELSTLLVRQYKYGANDFVWEFPAGKAESGENITSTAKRELMEETGYSSNDIRCVMSLFDNPSKSKDKVHICIARNCIKTQEQDLDETESNIEIKKISINSLNMNSPNTIFSSTSGLIGASLLSIHCYLQTKTK